jgi:gamma-glutamylcyclotransferase (GGCT)/AIG2-like uncharacterized protein YtfP
MTELFAYGTLRDAEYQLALFDRTLPTRPATLRGWRTAFTPSGYLTLVRDEKASVSGALVTLDAAAREVADAWEEVPLYELCAVRARDEHGAEVACHTYVRPSESGEPAPPDALARFDRAAVLEAIRVFRATRES